MICWVTKIRASNSAALQKKMLSKVSKPIMLPNLYIQCFVGLAYAKLNLYEEYYDCDFHAFTGVLY